MDTTAQGLDFRRLEKGTMDWWVQISFFLDGSKRRVFKLFTNEWVKIALSQLLSMEVMVWGFFGGEVAGDIVQIKSIIWKDEYHSILHRHAIPSGCRIIGQHLVLHHDNDSKHSVQMIILTH